MLRVTCDLCGKEISPGEDRHFVVKMQVHAIQTQTPLTEADLDQDHLEAVSQMLCEMEENAQVEPFPPACQQLRYDLCADCRERFLRNPLGKEPSQKFHFSEN